MFAAREKKSLGIADLDRIRVCLFPTFRHHGMIPENNGKRPQLDTYLNHKESY